jgi:hypothetical protein
MNINSKKDDDNQKYPTLSEFKSDRRTYLKRILKIASAVAVSSGSLFECSKDSKTPELSPKPLQLPPPGVPPQVTNQQPCSTTIAETVDPITTHEQESIPKTGVKPAVPKPRPRGRIKSVNQRCTDQTTDK